MLVHDGILLELEHEAQIAEAADVMRWAGREVCDGFEIGVDVDQMLTAAPRYPGQAAGGEGDVGDDHGCAGDRRRSAAEARA